MKLKALLITLAVIVVLALLGAAAYFVVIPRIAAMTASNASNVQMTNATGDNETSNAEDNGNGNEAAVVTGKDSVTATPSGATPTGVMADANYMFAEEEEEFIDQFILNFFGAESASVTRAALADENIPDIFNVSSNMIPKLLAGGEIKYGSEKYSDPEMVSQNLASIINDRYDRHVFIVNTHEAGSAVTYQGSVIVDLLNHKIVHIAFNQISPAHVSMVEEQYAALQRDLMKSRPGMESPVYDGNRRIKAVLAAIYSYSPYIDDLYWNTVPDYLRHANDLEVSSDDIAYWNMIDRMPTADGCGLRVLSIGEPMLINKNGNYNYFTCDISYRTDHGGAGTDHIINSTLRFYVNSDNGKIVYLTESNSSTSEISSLATNAASEPTIEELLGKTRNGE